MPPDVSLEETSHSSVTISWMAPDTELAVSGYRVRWRPETDANFVDPSEVSNTEDMYTISGLQPGTTYEIQVGAVFPAEVTWSPTLTATTVGGRAPAISVESKQQTSITVMLTLPHDSVGLLRYELRWRRADETEFSSPVDIPLDDTSYTITGLDAGTAYVIQVRTVDADGDGDWSSLEVTTTRAGGGGGGNGGGGTGQTGSDEKLPPVLSPGTQGQMSVTVTWVPPETTLEVSSYTLRWKKESGGDWIEVDNLGATATSHTIDDLDRETAYQVQMKAFFMDDGGSAWSSPVTVSTLPVPRIISIEAVAPSYDEDSNQVFFLLSVDKAIIVDLTVNFTVVETGAHRLDPDRRKTQEVLKRRNGLIHSLVIGIKTTNDSAVQPDSTITVTLQDGTGYEVGSPSSASTDVLDNDG